MVGLEANFQSVKFSERVEIILFTRENVALKLNRLLRLSNILLSKIPPAQKILLTGNWPLKGNSAGKTRYRQTALFAFETNIHIIIKISR